MRKILIRELQDKVDWHINGEPYDGSKIINICLNGVDAETVVLSLDSVGIAVSSGSACSAHISTPSHVLKALGLKDEQARSSIRISFSKNTTNYDISIAARAIVDVVKVLKGE